MNFAKTTARFWSIARIAAVSLSFTIVSIANAQYCAPAVFVGDLNNDNLVDTADVKLWTTWFKAGPPDYKPCADLNRNGVLDPGDREQLLKAVLFASKDKGGLGSKGRIPAFTLSEFRFAQPFVTDTQQRFVEFACPDPSSFPPDYLFSKKFEDGFYLLLVSKKNSGPPTINPQGYIMKVIPLKNILFASVGLGENLALLKDSSFTLPIPAGLTPTSLPVGQSISFQNQKKFNTTWFLVYRRPNGSGYTSPVAIPSVGQQIDTDPNTECQVDLSHKNSTLPFPNVMPPWDVILDAISVDKSIENPSSAIGKGCIYAVGPLFEAFPVPSGLGEFETPFHVYRLCPEGQKPKELRGEFQAFTVGIDTPGSKNHCSDDLACGLLSAGDCTKTHKTPFCNDPNCCSFVCLNDPHCCIVEWDTSCVALAIQECGVCGGQGSGLCLRAHFGKACSDETCCELVCNSPGFADCCNVSWDEDCVTKAKLPGMCLECGSSVLPNSCFEESDFPYCQDEECCNTVCLYDLTVCCEVVWDQYCVNLAEEFCPAIVCGANTAGDCCLAHEGPFCSDLICCQRVCDQDPYCCQTSWDVQCVEETILSGCGVSCACGGGLPSDTCFEPHPNPGCVSIRCCNYVCSSDPFCCGVTWDLSCVAAANGFCGEQPNCETSTFSCLIVHDTPGCSSPACCDAICVIVPDCCNISWDLPCVDLVPSVCEGCGEPFSGNCLAAHSSPGCNNAVCCDIVCAIDQYCCNTSWDDTCVAIATSACSLPPVCNNPDSRSCFISSFVPGCTNPNNNCCKSICETWDQYCCDVRWDAICANEAIISSKLELGFCRVPPAVPGQGDCSEVHEENGCANYQCSAAVCSLRPVCCTEGWDADCVELVPYVCVARTSCEDGNDLDPLLSPFLVHPTPGTNDYACCNAVCLKAGFEYCCEISWDTACVAQANLLCIYSLPKGEPWCVYGSGSCLTAHPTPGCEEESCSSAVCFYNAQCCIVEWDETCVALAGGICCGAPGCGNYCNGSCLIVHEKPFCSDPFCCTAVCEADPSCCQLGWDFNCVEYAYQRCARGCGIAESGSCRYPHKNPGCNNAICCEAICAQDPYCCQAEWDSTCAQEALKRPICGGLECGSYLAESCCSVHVESNGCTNLQCCNAVCLIDSFCCDIRWDDFCVEEAFDNPACPCAKECGDQCAGDCCSAHLGPNCRDADCCNLVCPLDPVCCETIWDLFCAQSARALCVNECEPPVCGSVEAGSCCEPHPNANCNSEECCGLVCAVLSPCCTTSWDESCSTLAGILCPVCSLSCGNSEAGKCFVAHPNPFCDDAQCCLRVCQVLPSCCAVQWDQDCADLALLKLCP